MTINEVMNALSICKRYRNCCRGCPYESISYSTKVGNTCVDVMHYDALCYLKQVKMDEIHLLLGKN